MCVRRWRLLSNAPAWLLLLCRVELHNHLPPGHVSLPEMERSYGSASERQSTFSFLKGTLFLALVTAVVANTPSLSDYAFLTLPNEH